MVTSRRKQFQKKKKSCLKESPWSLPEENSVQKVLFFLNNVLKEITWLLLEENSFKKKKKAAFRKVSLVTSRREQCLEERKQSCLKGERSPWSLPQEKC